MIGEGDAPARPRTRDCYRLKLNDSSVIIGKFEAESKLSIDAKFGKVDVSVADIARIDPATMEDHYRVTLANGDRVTGEVEFGKLTMKTSWGEAPLATKTLKSLESGKLIERPITESRPSPDGRTVVGVRRLHHEFHPDIGNPDYLPNSGVHPASAYTPYTTTPHPQLPNHAPATSVPVVPAPQFAPAPVPAH